jgi:hypothetical protein
MPRKGVDPKNLDFARDRGVASGHIQASARRDFDWHLHLRNGAMLKAGRVRLTFTPEV